MTPLLSLLPLAAGPLVALAAGVAGWGCARTLAPRAAANDNDPRPAPRPARVSAAAG